MSGVALTAAILCFLKYRIADSEIEIVTFVLTATCCSASALLNREMKNRITIPHFTVNSIALLFITSQNRLYHMFISRKSKPEPYSCSKRMINNLFDE